MSKTKREPIKYVKSWIVFVILIALITPWYFPTGSYQPLFFGIPYWALIIIAASLMLSATVSYVIKYQWHMVEEEEEERAKGD